MRACLIGEKLGHSFSREIHEKFGAHYDLVELSEDKLENFVRRTLENIGSEEVFQDNNLVS